MNVYQLLHYDAWATAKLLKAVESLSPQQFAHEFAGSLSSVRQQFVHLLSVADRYRARLAQEPVPNIQPESFITPQDLISYEAQMRRRLNEFMNRLPQDEFGRIVEHETRKGSFRATVEETLQHMVNHASYHRGQAACLLKLHGVDFADTDYIIWLNQAQT